MAETSVPNFEYIRRKVPIREIARELGLEVSGNTIRCWRPENHQHGDRTPSVGLHIHKNIAKCFVCDSRALSPIDLVMSVQDVELRAALRWILARYPVPNIPKGKHVQTPQRWPERFRVGTGGSRLDPLVRSGVWASLLPSERSILGVLDVFSDGDAVTISYRGLMRYAGIGSQSTVSSALKRFQNLHILQPNRKRTAAGLRACNSYRWTLDDPAFLSTVAEIRERQENEIKLERALRANAKAARKASLLPVNTLSSHWSTNESDAPLRV